MYITSPEQALTLAGILVAIIVAIWFTGAFATYVINKLSNKKRGSNETLD